MKVTTKDFQILEGENTFEFKPGINMVVGPNGSGKSSLFYAVENCLTNPNGVSDCINFNTDKSEVKLEANNESVSWIRTLDSSMYKNNKTKKDFVKASKLDSRDIANLGFYFDKKNRVVNIHDEWSVLFPFGESDTEMFRLFEDIFNISCSFQVIDEMKKDEQGVKAQIAQNQKEKQGLNDRLSVLSEIKEKVSLQDINNHINLVTEKLQRASELREDYATFSKSALLTQIVLPEVFDVSNLYDCSMNYQQIKNDYDVYQASKKKADIKVPTFNIDLNMTYPNDLKKDYENYIKNTDQIKQNNEMMKSLKEQETQLQEKISKIKVCPTCGRPLEE